MYPDFDDDIDPTDIMGASIAAWRAERIAGLDELAREIAGNREVADKMHARFFAKLSDEEFNRMLDVNESKKERLRLWLICSPDSPG
jgi:hypothetical protein